MLAVHTPMIELLLHQLTAVYDEMLSRQPPGFAGRRSCAGKTAYTVC
ncbi:MAG: hypothetical protein R2856_27895 [Caldilineaceae bacterium]